MAQRCSLPSAHPRSSLAAVLSYFLTGFSVAAKILLTSTVIPPLCTFVSCCRSDAPQRGCRAVELRHRFNERTYLERILGFGEEWEKAICPSLAKLDLNICNDGFPNLNPFQFESQILQTHLSLQKA